MKKQYKAQIDDEIILFSADNDSEAMHIYLQLLCEQRDKPLCHMTEFEELPIAA